MISRDVLTIDGDPDRALKCHARTVCEVVIFGGYVDVVTLGSRGN